MSGREINGYSDRHEQNHPRPARHSAAIPYSSAVPWEPQDEAASPSEAVKDFINARLTAAHGALELGIPELANDELEDIPHEYRLTRHVMELRTMIYEMGEAWDLMRETARFLVEKWPEDSQHWIWVAYATRRCRSVEEAEDWLMRGMEAHPNEPFIPFNLACYAAVTGRIEEAKQRLERAIRLNPVVRGMALDDPDLKPLWESLGDPREINPTTSVE